jgi:TRAP-type C4-dicarboxylate transport system permease small subunit
VLPTLLLRSLLPPGMKTAWPMFAGMLTVAAFFFVATASYRWTESRTTTVILTIASLATTLVGSFVLLLSALTSTWG